MLSHAACPARQKILPAGSPDTVCQLLITRRRCLQVAAAARDVPLTLDLTPAPEADLLLLPPLLTRLPLRALRLAPRHAGGAEALLRCRLVGMLAEQPGLAGCCRPNRTALTSRATLPSHGTAPTVVPASLTPGCRLPPMLRLQVEAASAASLRQLSATVACTDTLQRFPALAELHLHAGVVERLYPGGFAEGGL